MATKRQLFVILLSVIFTFSFAFANESWAQRRPSPEQVRKLKRLKRKSRPATQVKYISTHRMAGCGLGAQIFDSDEKFSQVAASLVNFTGLQSVMISFGISGCTYDGITEDAHETRAFVESNVADIRYDLSVGGGEYLSALSSLYGCGESVKSRFVSELKAAYATKGQRAMQPEEIILMMNTVVAQNMELARSCGTSQLASAGY